jgi:serine O-acetyltransferase
MSGRGGLDELVGAFLKSYRDDTKGQFINKRYIPSRDEIIEILHLMTELFYPGYFGRQDLTDENVAYHVGATLLSLREKLERQIELCLCYGSESGERVSPDVPRCRTRGKSVAAELMSRLPAIRQRLILDVQAAYDGDPAASGIDEVILAYPGLLAVTVHRVAHELSLLGVPLMPRIMSEWAHAQTGADIHPDASIGDSFFVDHATGVVIGATSHIGAHVKLYQGVTLGALSMPRDANGNLIRGTRRHPTLEDHVTIYANATVLGGDTIIGKGSLLGGSVFITRSVPEGHRVALDPPKLRVATPRRAEGEEAQNSDPKPGDVNFDI